MNFLADEGVDFPVVQRLRSDGHLEVFPQRRSYDLRLSR